jgi:ribonuclease III
MIETNEHQQLQSQLGYVFKAPELLLEALRHSSFANEQSDPTLHDNERLEFLGDAVLNLVIGHLLMTAYPHMKEGELSRIRSHMVNEAQLADLARRLQLGRFLKLGRGEIQSAGHDKSSILANAMEALIAAIYLDGGFAAVFTIIQDQFRELIAAAPRVTMGLDYKSRLQEAIQSMLHEVPHYQVVEESGPDHDKTFRVAMTVGRLRAEGQGKSKKLAEQEAARKGLEAIADRSGLTIAHHQPPE